MPEDREPLDPYVQWIVTEARRPVILDPLARERLMEAVRAEPVPRRRRLAWLTEPREIALRPLASLALAAGLVGVGVIAGHLTTRDGRQSIEQAQPVAVGNPQLPDSLAPAPRAIKFVLVAPEAGRVSLVGDFNRWDPAATPLVRNSDGSWTGYVTLRPGMHTYSFVLDDRHFVSDPAAPMAPDDGYGHKSSVVFVRGPAL
jgi:hypothetical protein